MANESADHVWRLAAMIAKQIDYDRMKQLQAKAISQVWHRVMTHEGIRNGSQNRLDESSLQRVYNGVWNITTIQATRRRTRLTISLSLPCATESFLSTNVIGACSAGQIYEHLRKWQDRLLSHVCNRCASSK